MGEMQLIKKNIPDDVSKRITALRWFGIFLVIVMHSFQTVDFLGGFSKLADIHVHKGSLFTFFSVFAVRGIGAGAVPMFFLFSGYLDFMRPKPYGQCVKVKARSLMIPYLIWTAICIGLCLLSKGIIGEVANLQFVYSRSPKEWFAGLFGHYNSLWKGGSSRNVYLAFQLWYVRDLFIITLIIPAIRWFLEKIPVPFFFTVISLMMLDMHPVILGIDSLVFYSLGAAWAMYDLDLLKKCDECKLWAILPIFAFLAWYTTWGEYNMTAAWINRSVSLVIILKFSAWILKNDKLFDISKYLSEYSFFVFLLHGYPFILIGFAISSKIFDISKDVSATMAVFLTIILLSVGCTLIGIVLKKICKPLFSFLIGGRAK